MLSHWHFEYISKIDKVLTSREEKEMECQNQEQEYNECEYTLTNSTDARKIIRECCIQLYKYVAYLQTQQMPKRQLQNITNSTHKALPNQHITTNSIEKQITTTHWMSNT